MNSESKKPAAVTDELAKAISDAIDCPTDDQIRKITVAVFRHDREYPEAFVTCYTRPMHHMVAQALKYKTPGRRIEELRLVDDRAYRLPGAVRDALEQRKA